MGIISLHRIGSYLLLTTGTTAMWLGEPEETFPYPAGVLAAAVLAYLTTDQRRFPRISHTLSYFFAIGGLVVAAFAYAIDGTNPFRVFWAICRLRSNRDVLSRKEQL